jgi:hypothetical protein
VTVPPVAGVPPVPDVPPVPPVPHVAAHMPLHMLVPTGQAQTPAWQSAPRGQRFPHALQLLGSVERSVHTLPGQVVSVQVALHVRAEQN